MGSISRHITPLVINSLGRRHTHTHTNTHTDDLHRINSKKPGVCRPVAGECLVKKDTFCTYGVVLFISLPVLTYLILSTGFMDSMMI